MRRLLTRSATGICAAGLGLAIAYAWAPGRGAVFTVALRAVPRQATLTATR